MNPRMELCAGLAKKVDSRQLAKDKKEKKKIKKIKLCVLAPLWQKLHFYRDSNQP